MGVASIYFRGCQRFSSAKRELATTSKLTTAFSVNFFIVAEVDQRVLGPVSCLAEILSTAVFALRNGKF